MREPIMFFYCDKCRVKDSLPTKSRRSKGMCQLCGTVDDCHEGTVTDGYTGAPVARVGRGSRATKRTQKQRAHDALIQLRVPDHYEADALDQILDTNQNPGVGASDGTIDEAIFTRLRAVVEAARTFLRLYQEAEEHLKP